MSLEIRRVVQTTAALLIKASGASIEGSREERGDISFVPHFTLSSVCVYLYEEQIYSQQYENSKIFSYNGAICLAAVMGTPILLILKPCNLADGGYACLFFTAVWGPRVNCGVSHMNNDRLSGAAACT